MSSSPKTQNDVGNKVFHPKDSPGRFSVIPEIEENILQVKGREADLRLKADLCFKDYTDGPTKHTGALCPQL